jgi:hypothetical protein
MRKTVTYLNSLRREVEAALHEISETGIDIEIQAERFSRHPASDLTNRDSAIKEGYDNLVALHKKLGKQLKEFKKIRDNYISFF